MINLKTNGVTIGNKHSYNDFGLIMTSKNISAPEPQLKTVSVPGRNGFIDMSEVLTGNVRYNPRTIQLEFYTDKAPLEWTSFASDLHNAFQGQKMRIIFDDDIAFYWLGRTELELTNSGRRATLTLTATVDPYKYNITSSSEDWLWDPFDFEYGVINETADIVVNGSKSITIAALQRWENPVIVSSAPMTVTFNGATYSIAEGSQVMYDIIIEAGDNTLTFSGNGTVTVNYVGGML